MIKVLYVPGVPPGDYIVNYEWSGDRLDALYYPINKVGDITGDPIRVTIREGLRVCSHVPNVSVGRYAR